MKWTFGLLILVLAIAALLLGAGEFLSRPVRREIGPPPAALQAKALRIALPDGGAVAGWFHRGRPGGAAVLLLHGVRGDRSDMAGRAAPLVADGYSVLLIDLPSHGESTGDRITFGAHEAAGVRAALAWMRVQLPGERIGVIGVSLGAASLVLSRPDPAPDAVVLEMMYPTIRDAVQDRLAMRLGDTAGRALAPLLLWQLPLRSGVSEQDLRPIDAVRALHSPLLVMAGTRDEHTRWSETQALFEAANAPKALWPVDGAAHVNLHAFAPRAYEMQVMSFLEQYLRGAR
ncbi:alpha/beta hydrolase [Burkholderiaceae bacterium UC74_6]